VVGAGTFAVIRAFPLLAAALAALAACSAYDPPVAGDHGAEKYKADLEACRTSVGHDVYVRNAGDIGTWVLSPVTGPGQRRAGIRSCMAGKGYVVEKS
jgi:hypothetical protein